MYSSRVVLGNISKMASEQCSVRPPRTPRTCSPEEMLVQYQKEFENDTESVNSDDSCSILTQSQHIFPVKLKREMAMARQIDVPATSESCPSKNVSGYLRRSFRFL